jgi:hypothetical protein
MITTGLTCIDKIKQLAQSLNIKKVTHPTPIPDYVIPTRKTFNQAAIVLHLDPIVTPESTGMMSNYTATK